MSAYYSVYVKDQDEIIGQLDEHGVPLSYRLQDDTEIAVLKRQNTLATILSQIRRGIVDEERLVVVNENDQRVSIKDIKEQKVKRRRRNLSAEEKNTITDMKARGFSLSQIASILAISRNTIKSLLGRSQTT